MIVVSGITMQFEAKPLFSDVSVMFGGENRYGLIGTSMERIVVAMRKAIESHSRPA